MVGVGFSLDSACSVWVLVSVSIGGSWGSLVLVALAHSVEVGVGVDRPMG